jgi:hypothetical protein
MMVMIDDKWQMLWSGYWCAAGPQKLEKYKRNVQLYK